MRQAHGLLDDVRFQVPAAHDEVVVDLREDLRIGGRALGGQLHVAAVHVLVVLLEDHHHVVGGAAACAGQHHFHGARGEIAPAAFGGAVHGHQVAAARLCHEGHAVTPTYRAVHSVFLS